MVPLIPVMLEFSCEISFPTGEASTIGFIYALAHVIGGVGGIGLTFIIGELPLNPSDDDIKYS